MDRILLSKKPVISTMGKPESREEHKAVNRVYLPEYDQLQLLMTRPIRESAKVVFISGYVRDIWVDIFKEKRIPFPDDSKVKVILHGVDTDAFKPATNKPVEPFVIGSVGAFREIYRLATLFRMSQLISLEHNLLIVGSMNAEAKNVFDSAMQDPQLKARTTYIPWVAADRLPEYYHKMHCLFHPVDYEGCGIVVAEALACGVPVVVPAHGAPKEFVLPGGGIAVNTVQFIYDDLFCELMAQAVVNISQQWDSYSKGARQQAVNLVSITSTMDNYLDFMGLPRYANANLHD